MPLTRTILALSIIGLLPSIAASSEDQLLRPSYLSPDKKDLLETRYIKLFDRENGGWERNRKQLEPYALEYALLRAGDGDKKYHQMALQTLEASLQLVDSTAGGMFEAGKPTGWKPEDFSKTLRTEAQAVRLFSLGSSVLREPGFLESARTVQKHIDQFLLSPKEEFWAGQKAVLNGKTLSHDYFRQNLEDRIKIGVPDVQKSVLPADNALTVISLTSLYDASPDPTHLNAAQNAAQQLLRTEKKWNHDIHARLSFISALLRLYASTGERPWLQQAQKRSKGLMGTDVTPKDIALVVDTVRIFNLLHHYTGDPENLKVSDSMMKQLSKEKGLQSADTSAAMLLADFEITHEPIHVAVVGKKDDPEAKALFMAGLRYPSNYKRIEWIDRSEGPPPNPDIKFPTLEKAAAFACANRSCSLPVFEPNQVALAVDRLLKRSRPL